MRVRVRAALVRIADNRDCFCGGLEDKGNLWPRRTKPLPLARRLWNSLAATVSEVADSLSAARYFSRRTINAIAPRLADAAANRGTESPRNVDTTKTEARRARSTDPIAFIRELTPRTGDIERARLSIIDYRSRERERCCQAVSPVAETVREGRQENGGGGWGGGMT
jgi:hypothetical protein